jgi:O-methyltransferase
MKALIKQLVIWCAHSPLLSWPRRFLADAVFFAIESRGRVIISYDDSQRRPVLDLIRKIKRETSMILDDNEAYQISMAVKRTEKVQGDVAEVGVFRGGSAKLICQSNGGKPLHLFDTFEGIPKVAEVDQPAFYEGQFAASMEEVKNYLKDYKNIYFYKGIFPGTAKPVENKRFSFVHLDVDTYESTLACLHFFYPRMNQGGILLSHDYINHQGVKKAFDEFFEEKQEPIIEMSGTQCLIVKL